MKSTKLNWITKGIVFLALAIPIQLTAQHTQYTIIDLGTPGTFNWAFDLNNGGQAVSGFSTFPGDGNRHAVLWQEGVLTDLGTLGGLNSVAAGISERAEITGYAETSTPDPLGEDFCFSGNHVICLPRFRSLTCVRVQFDQLMQVLPDVPPASGTPHCSRLFFVHRDTTSRTEPLTAEARTCLGEAKIFRLFGLAHET
jgi:probable HAF family extracellular repeat protein